MREIKKIDWDKVIECRGRAYRNLENGTISVLTRQLNSKGNINWLLAGHTTSLLMENVKFHIYENGRQKVIDRKRKNVHAWAEGVITAPSADAAETPIDVAYNPYFNDTFVKRHTNVPIKTAKYLAVRSNRVFCSADAIACEWTIVGSEGSIFQPSYNSFNLVAA